MTTPTLEQSGYLFTLEDVASMLQKAQSNMKKCPKHRLTEGYVQARLMTIEDYWNTFKHAHHNLTKCTPMEQRGVLPYFLNKEFYKYEEIYLCMHADLTDLLLKSQKRVTDTSSLSHVSQDGLLSFAKLPRIKLPVFSGKYEDWPSYQDLFLALVHNSSMSDVQKLHYLKTSISGEAELLLRNIQITESNYTRAWDLLKARFGNKRMITKSIFQRLFNQKRESNQSAMQIKSILDTTAECLSSLENLKIATDSWDPVIIFLVSQKLDTESLKDWEEQAYRESSDEMPTWEDMKKFLEFRFRTLELSVSTAVSREKQSSHKSFHVTIGEHESMRFQSAHVTTRTPRICTYCKASEHCIKNCNHFIQLPVEERHSFVKKNSICFNCLLPTPRLSYYICLQLGNLPSIIHSQPHSSQETEEESTNKTDTEEEITNETDMEEEIIKEIDMEEVEDDNIMEKDSTDVSENVDENVVKEVKVTKEVEKDEVVAKDTKDKG